MNNKEKNDPNTYGIKLREKALSSPLFDTKIFVKDFEKLLKDVIYKEKRTELLLLGEKACDKFIEKNKEACENLLNISVYQNLII